MEAFLHVSCPVAVWVITALKVLFMLLAFRAGSVAKGLCTCWLRWPHLGCFTTCWSSHSAHWCKAAPPSALSRMCFVAHGALIPLLFLSGFLMFAFPHSDRPPATLT